MNATSAAIALSLNDCTEKMMLQRVGKIYRFTDRLLQQSFANM